MYEIVTYLDVNKINVIVASSAQLGVEIKMN